MTPPSASRPTDQQRATATPGVSGQIASTNRTANAFLGRRPSWLTAQRPSANPASGKPQVASRRVVSVLPPLQEAPPQPAPEQIPSAQAELSQRSDSSLLSPAPTDRASPNDGDKDSSPILSTTPLPGLRPGHSNDTDSSTAATHQRAPPTSLPPPSSSSPDKSPAATGPEARATTSVPPATSYAFSGLARFALIDPTPEEIRASPRLATKQSVQDVMQPAPNTTPAPASASTPIAAQDPAPSSASPSAPALIPAPTPVQTPATPAPTAVIDLESSSETITSSPHMPAASLPPATAERNPHFAALMAMNKKSSPLFKYVDYVGSIREKIALLSDDERLTADTEAPRLSIIVEACRHEDGFFILVHQLYCLWSVDRLTCYKHLKPMKSDAIDTGFKVIELIFKRNELMRPAIRVWLASFPRAFNSMMADPSPYARVLPEVVAFLTCLPLHWDLLRLKVTQRGYPVLMDELVSQLFCLSPILQTIVFTSSRRQLGIVDGEFGAKIERLFRADQRAHNPEPGMFVGLPCDCFSSLEQVNAHLIASYRNIIARSKAKLLSRAQAANLVLASAQGHNAQNQAQPQVPWQQQQQSPTAHNVTRPTSQHRSPSSTSPDFADYRDQASWPETLERIGAQNALAHAQQGYQQTMHSVPGPADVTSLSAFAEQMAQQQILPNQQQAMQAIPAQVPPAAGRANATSLQTAEALHVTQMQQMQEMQQKVLQQMQQLGQMPQMAGSPEQTSQMQSAYQQQMALLNHQMQRMEQTFQAYKSQLEQLQLAQMGQGSPTTRLDAHVHMVPTQQPQSQLIPYQHHPQQQQQQWMSQQQPAHQQHMQTANALSPPMRHQAQQQMHRQMQMQRQQAQRLFGVPSQALNQHGPQPQVMPSTVQAMQFPGGMHAMRHMNSMSSSLQSPVPSPTQSPNLHQHNRLPDARRRPSASASFVADIMHGAAPLQPQQQQQQVQTDQATQIYPAPDVYQQAQIQREIHRQENRANPTLRANQPQPGARVQRQTASPAKQSAKESMFPPRGITIPLGEQPHDPSDRRAIAMSLAQARCRSPSRVIVDANTKKAVRPELAGTRFYQFVQRLALGPAPTPARLYTYHLEFSVTEEEYALRAVKVIPEGELLPVEKHFDGSLQYRLRCCKGRGQGAATTEGDWVTMNTTWPANIFIKVNGHVVTARRKTHNGRDMPADITRLVRVGVNRVQVVISAPPQQPPSFKLYMMGVDVVETASHQRVWSQIEKHGVQDASVTLNEIMGRLQRSASDDDDFALVQEDLSVDLADPFSARIFTTPVRGAQCQHIECFDLENWLTTRPCKPPQPCQHVAGCSCPKTPEPTLPDKWRCPICSRDARPASLRIDQFLVNVRQTLKDTGKLGRVKSILVAKDGTWKPVVEDDDDDVDDNDDGMGPAPSRPRPPAKDKGKRRATASPSSLGGPVQKAARVASGSGPAAVASSRRSSQAVVIELDSD